MESIILNESTEREEGEIVDDDLEAISDDSIVATPAALGKLESHKQHLRALSLSSVSDTEEAAFLPKLVTPKLTVKKRKVRRRSSTITKRKKISNKTSKHHHHKSRSNSSSDSDENVSVTKRLLKEAIRIDSKEGLNNSLRTRLKGMVKDPEIGTSNINIEKRSLNHVDMIPSPVPCIINLDSPEPFILEDPVSGRDSEKGGDYHDSPIELDQDSELIHLRLEALKTAVINKFQNRKKKISEGHIQKTNNLEINKENSSDNVNLNNSPERDGVDCIEENNEHGFNNSEEDEDEDILRAVLLASIAKKITNKVSPTNIKSKNNTSLNNGTVSPKLPNLNLPIPSQKQKSDIKVPKIPRFIISVNNSDSNSDDNSVREEIKEHSTKKEILPDIQKEVENEVEKFLKQQRAEVEAKQRPVAIQPKVKKPVTVSQTLKPETNNLYKLLPKNKQLEYEKLIQRLKSAEKKHRIRKLSTRTTDLKNTRIRTSSKSGESSRVPECKAQTRTQIAGTYQKTLKNMQTQINGRLQIEGKYHVLAPLMKKLNEASLEQKKQEMQIKLLLNQLKEARTQSTKSQQHFHNLLTEFLKKKDDIDKRSKDTARSNGMLTSTNSRNRQCKVVPKSNQHPLVMPKMDLKPQETLNCTVVVPQETLKCTVVVEKCPVDLTDPNDIEFKKLDVLDGGTLLKYTSPLDSKTSSNKRINPLEILCPFEINGCCRDKDCTFNHCN